MRERQRKYERTAKGQRTQRRYNRSAKGIVRAVRYGATRRKGVA